MGLRVVRQISQVFAFAPAKRAGRAVLSSYNMYLQRWYRTDYNYSGWN